MCEHYNGCSVQRCLAGPAFFLDSTNCSFARTTAATLLWLKGESRPERGTGLDPPQRLPTGAQRRQQERVGHRCHALARLRAQGWLWGQNLCRLPGNFGLFPLRDVQSHLFMLANHRAHSFKRLNSNMKLSRQSINNLSAPQRATRHHLADDLVLIDERSTAPDSPHVCV